MSKPPAPARIAEVLLAVLRAATNAGREVQRADVDRNGKITLVMTNSETISTDPPLTDKIVM